jgi:hypothetical protein
MHTNARKEAQECMYTFVQHAQTFLRACMSAYVSVKCAHLKTNVCMHTRDTYIYAQTVHTRVYVYTCMCVCMHLKYMDAWRDGKRMHVRACIRYMHVHIHTFTQRVYLLHL